MRLINANAFLEREGLIREGMPVNCRTKVLESRDDEVTAYATLSHRWIDQEVDYDEMVKLAKMEEEERDEIRQRDGYRKILDSCEQAKRDGYEWLWADTCCIDKRSSAELSEAINSMYRWYKNSRVCYVYLHDVPGPSFPTKDDKRTYPKSNGWPEWFSRGWTLQEMIAPSDVRFFNNDWQPIGDKRTLARILSLITRVPQHILTGGLSSSRPCVAQIMSWAAGRITTRVEDRAYSLLGLLDVNMPMLYGEGKKAFHRLQLEIIRTSNDQSIFAWGLATGDERAGSILADDPNLFWDCDEIELMDHDEFIRHIKEYRVPEEELHSIEEDRFGTFLITNRGIQIWMLLCPLVGSDSVFEAWLPCCFRRSNKPVRITLALWKSNYYRYSTSDGIVSEATLQFCQVYLRYQDTSHHATFEIDDSAIIQNGFTYRGAYPSNLTGNTLTLTSHDPLCVKVYSDTQGDCRIAVGFGQCLGQDWIHVIYGKPTREYSWEMYARSAYGKMLVKGPEYARSMAEARSRGGRYGRLLVKHTCLAESTWTVQTSCIMWESSRNCGVRIDAFRYPYDGPDKWRVLDVEGTDDSNCDIRGLMMRHSPRNGMQIVDSYPLCVDGAYMEFSRAPSGIKLGDYGYFTDSENFSCEGNIFADFGQNLASVPDITPRQHKISQMYGQNTDHDYVETHGSGFLVALYKPLGLSLPSDRDVNSFLASLSTELTNKYLVVGLIKCVTVPPSELSRQPSHRASAYRSSTFHLTEPLCIIRKPFVWHRDEGVGPASVERSGDELGAKTKDGRMRDVVDSVVAKRGFFGRMFAD
ncbi:heterokaryon incompatibility protein-domain-containing protein [Scleroderma yunnanense]